MRKKENTSDKLLEGTSPDFIRSIVDSVLHSLVASGEISKQDLNNHEKVFEKLRKFSDGTGEINFIIDHRSSILENANIFFKNKEYGFAIIFYAMYFEHSINNIISHRLKEKNVTKKSNNELIKSTNINGKFTWVLEILELPKFNKKYLKTINSASSERNSLIHYKWNPVDESKEQDKELLLLIEDIKKAVTYLKKYESRVLYKNSKGLITKFMQQSSNKKA